MQSFRCSLLKMDQSMNLEVKVFHACYAYCHEKSITRLCQLSVNLCRHCSSTALRYYTNTNSSSSSLKKGINFQWNSFDRDRSNFMSIKQAHYDIILIDFQWEPCYIDILIVPSIVGSYFFQRFRRIFPVPNAVIRTSSMTQFWLTFAYCHSDLFY